MRPLIAIVLFAVQLFAQSNIKIMSYKLLNYPGSDTTTRNPYFRTVLAYVNPDVLVVQEITSQVGVNGFLANVLNAYGEYSAGTFIDGYNSDNAIFYKTDLFNFVSNTPIATALRDINEFKLTHIISSEPILIYSVHLKSSTGSDNEAKRAAEVANLRNVTNALPTGSNFIVLGDFNIYDSDEAAYINLLQDNPGEDVQWSSLHINGRCCLIGHIVKNTFYLIFLDKDHRFWITKKNTLNRKTSLG